MHFSKAAARVVGAARGRVFRFRHQLFHDQFRAIFSVGTRRLGAAEVGDESVERVHAPHTPAKRHKRRSVQVAPGAPVGNGFVEKRTARGLAECIKSLSVRREDRREGGSVHGRRERLLVFSTGGANKRQSRKGMRFGVFQRPAIHRYQVHSAHAGQWPPFSSPSFPLPPLLCTQQGRYLLCLLLPRFHPSLLARQHHDDHIPYFRISSQLAYLDLIRKRQSTEVLSLQRGGEGGHGGLTLRYRSQGDQALIQHGLWTWRW